MLKHEAKAHKTSKSLQIYDLHFAMLCLFSKISVDREVSTLR